MSRITYRGRDQWSSNGRTLRPDRPLAREELPSWRLVGLFAAIFLITGYLFLRAT